MTKTKRPHPLAAELRREAARIYQGRKAGMIDSMPLTRIVQAAMREAPEVLREFEATSYPHLVLSLSEYGIDEITFNDYRNVPEPAAGEVRILINEATHDS
jgi:hypothetical protein